MAEKVIVATDSEEVKAIVEKNGGEAVLTPSDLPSGTDRVFEAVKDKDFEYILNLQGDEPLIEGGVLDKVFNALFEGDCDIATPYYITSNNEEAQNPNRVKIVSNTKNFALYFSRSLIPYPRDDRTSVVYKIHIGVYGYKKESLKKFVKLKESQLEKIEKLEQLRALENNMKIKLVEVNFKPSPIDTFEDVKVVEEKLISRGTF